MKKCELCKIPARVFCESDQASLCWDCDAKVHGANFLVARHSRTLLCHSCRSPTPWKASGASLGSAVTVCDRCAAGTSEEEEPEESEGGNEEEIDDDDEDVAGDEGGDNQVVPWSSTPPPPPASSSSSEWSSVSTCRRNGVNSRNGDGDGDISVSEPVTTTVSLKRQRPDEASDRDLQEGHNGWASQRRCGGEWREEVACGGEPPSKE
ncbi:B-box zinc finger protein 32-like [Abrus precatorius]|uniref:B-box zinc finger protein 32-like n=1 Tax=Abrus precatorius TaxID=3816 RepID=A0A8B8KXD6_ABRPR|nr:B-box zinc finger protein 32-like [Abrus precatorius]